MTIYVKDGKRWAIVGENADNSIKRIREVNERDECIGEVHSVNSFEFFHNWRSEAEITEEVRVALLAVRVSQVGDVVRLKCGGPPMVVVLGPDEVDGYPGGRIKTLWHAESGGLLDSYLAVDWTVPF